jgi:hypothetical protein
MRWHAKQAIDPCKISVTDLFNILAIQYHARREDEHISSPARTSSTITSPFAATENADQTSTPGMIFVRLKRAAF